MSRGSNGSDMHPRNKYRKNPPDFKKLAAKYQEFRKYCKLELNGKISLDFKCPDAVRSLTITLLKDDFGLTVDLPHDSLVPRIPLRLNYLLWLEDILIENCFVDNVKGFDIGTGASCVYPLLGSTLFGWTFVATDRDQASVDFACKNIKENNLNDKIDVIKVEENIALIGVADRYEDDFVFCMCNPPFFDNRTSSTSRSARTEPHSATVAKPTEISADGGEIAFVSRIIDDSCQLRTKFKMFSSMVGKKSSLKPLKAKLRNIDGVVEISTTTFCQGKTQRWALAWTFDKFVRLKLNETKNATRPPLILTIPESALNQPSFATAKQWTLSTLDSLKIRYEEIQTYAESSSFRFVKYSAEAESNTWSHQRRKRRAQKNQEESPPTKRAKIERGGEDNRLFATAKFEEETKLKSTLKFEFVVKQFESKFTLEFFYVSGESADCLNQILQYFANKTKNATKVG